MSRSEIGTVLKASTVLTTAYTGWISDKKDLGSVTKAALFFSIGNQNATLITVKTQSSADKGVTWSDVLKDDGTLEEFAITVAAASEFNVKVDLTEFSHVRFLAKADAAAAGDTLGLKILPVMSGSASKEVAVDFRDTP